MKRAKKTRPDHSAAWAEEARRRPGGVHQLRIDMHAHLIPPALIDELRTHADRYPVRVVDTEKGLAFHHTQGFQYPVQAEFYDPQAAVAALDRLKLDHRILSIAPTLFSYELDQETRNRVCRLYNDGAAEVVRQHGRQLSAMAAVPLPDVDAAISELERAVKLGLTGVEIGTNIERRTLDDPAFFPFFQRAADLAVPVFLHPYYVGPKPMIERFYLTNSIGNPLDTAIAIANLIHGGVLERLPHLNIVLAHGGGFFPYQLGRLDHAFQVRKEPKAQTKQPPSAQLGGLYFDTITHWAPALRFLVGAFGADKVMLGSDHPFDMGPDDPATVVLESRFDAETQEAVLGGNAARLYGIR